MTWDGTWFHERPPAQLESEVLEWGIPAGREQRMILDLLRERRKAKGSLGGQ